MGIEPNFSDAQLLSFFLILIRTSAFLVVTPLFGAALVPAIIKVLVSLLLGVALFPLVDLANLNLDISALQFLWLVSKEVFVGLAMGFVTKLFFFVISVAGQLASLSMGISSAQILDPARGTNSSSLEQVEMALAMLFFLAMNGHHVFILGLVKSFELAPLGTEGLLIGGLAHFGDYLQVVMLMGVQLSAPIMLSILFMNLTMAVIGRSVPQINVLITSLPVNILVGFLILIVCMPLFVWEMHEIKHATASKLFEFMKTF